jgi:hypothetical protein
MVQSLSDVKKPLTFFSFGACLPKFIGDSPPSAEMSKKRELGGGGTYSFVYVCLPSDGRQENNKEVKTSQQPAEGLRTMVLQAEKVLELADHPLDDLALA